MKKSLVLITIIAALFISGCVEGTFHVTVNTNGSADLNYRIGMNSGLMGLMSTDQQNPLDDLSESAEKNGFIVTGFNENNVIGIVAKKHVESLNSIPAIGGFDNNSENSGPSITVDKGFFKNTYKVDGNIDLTDMKVKQGDDFAGIGNAMLSQMKLNFILSLPVKPEQHNASSVQDEGRTLVWQLIPGSNNKIEMNASVPNSANIITATVIGLIIIAVIVVFSRRKPAPEKDFGTE